jgi:cell division ATPase FtsA
VGVVLTGGGARIRGLPAWIGKRFGGATVRLGVPRWKLAEDLELPAEVSGTSACALCGLLLLGAQGRTDLRQRCGNSFFGRLTGTLRRLVASL